MEVNRISNAPAPGTLRSVIAGNVLALMGRHRVSQTKLGLVLDMSQPSLSKRLNSQVPWTVDQLEKIAEFFDLDITELFTQSRWSVGTPALGIIHGDAGDQRELPFDRCLVSVGD